jgi:hypothetical protein
MPPNAKRGGHEAITLAETLFCRRHVNDAEKIAK